MERSAPGVLAAICPFLISADGSWRSATPAREHRCGALEPSPRLPLEKQERLCLTSGHLNCPLFEVAAGLSKSAGESDDLDAEADALRRRPMPRTTPVVLDRAGPRLPPIIPELRLPSVRERLATLRLGRAASDAPARTRASVPVGEGPIHGRDPSRGLADEPGRAMDRTQRSESAASGEPRTIAGASLPGPGTGHRAAQGGDPRHGLQGQARPPRGAAGAERPLDRVAAEGTGRARSAQAFAAIGRWTASNRTSLPARVTGAIAGREIQTALVGVMVIALVAVLAVRFTGTGTSAGVAGASSSPHQSAVASSARPSPSRPATSAPAPTVAAGSPAATGGIAAAPTVAAATPRPTAKASPTPAAARTYKVRAGDTLYAIAKRFKTTVAKLMELNNITDPRTLQVGQILKLP